MERKPVIGVLLGDGTGVGPELVVKLASARFFDTLCKPVVIGDKRVFEQGMRIVGKQVAYQLIGDISEADWNSGAIPFLDQADLDPETDYELGEVSVKSGAAVLAMIEKAAELFLEKKIEGFCFAPFNKEAMKMAGCKFESEHHLLADIFGHTGPFGEINVLGDLWTTRTTSHIPIKEVSSNLSVDTITRAITLADSSLRNSGIAKPRLGLAALNPHAGEHGLCGREELDIIEPAIAAARAKGIDATGPYPSDILFIRAFRGEFDGVVTMYHDQGQIALKLKGFDEGITIAGGLPAPIATCAHGTAYDIVGKNIAGTRAFENAVKMTSRMANHMASGGSV
ncbi:MAG: 4-hydroxythreonine-4-phosphate dehydrogenase PdxA [Sphaerochaeta sp.]|jgi:4-hydroxythreonine-4-phosphate dehydrogenase|nr:4-hydroxythreonine-4-phosphate dehydrogenase PdxA [Sphaerochaeta sp.]PKL29279.1 MAG: 4-hydroxythreonine-4-phosphate dehydrogenase [Spirochaetae bacterium HGW-Spirochaetae-2]